jgi:hypothetical protein
MNTAADLPDVVCSMICAELPAGAKKAQWRKARAYYWVLTYASGRVSRMHAIGSEASVRLSGELNELPEGCTKTLEIVEVWENKKEAKRIECQTPIVQIYSSTRRPYRGR